MERVTNGYETMEMYLVNLNLANKVCGKVHILTKLTKCPIQYLQESLNPVDVLEKEKFGI